MNTTNNTDARPAESAQHTPGPWMIDRAYYTTSNDLLIREDNGGDESRVCRVLMDSPEICFDEGEANARLIASAPALLAERDALREDAAFLSEALAGCADALHEAGKAFAVNNPTAARPNLYERHEAIARAALAKAQGGAK